MGLAIKYGRSSLYSLCSKNRPARVFSFEFRHYNQSDSEMIRSYGETEYRSYVRLSSVAEVEKDYPINDYTVTIKYRFTRVLSRSQCD